MKKLVHERMDAGNTQAHPIHRPFYKIGIASLALTTAFTFGSAAFNQTSAQDTSTKVVSSQSAKQLPPELAKLTKVSLDTLQKLDKKSELNRKITHDFGTSFMTIIHAFQADESSGIAVTAEICQQTGCHAKIGSGSLTDKFIIVGADEKILRTIDLAPFDSLYRKATGNEIKFVRLIAFTSVDSDIGPYAGVYVVPVEKPDAKIKGNIPIFVIASPHNTKKVYTDENLVAMR